MGGEENERREQKRDRDRDHGHRDRQPAWLVEPALDADHDCSSPPAISNPSSSTVAVDASRSPTIAPSYMTAMRSASVRISSRSSLISRTPTPRSAASRRYACTTSMPATSRPRVGDAATSTTGSPENSRASQDFCRFAPDSYRVGAAGPAVGTSDGSINDRASSRILPVNSTVPRAAGGLRSDFSTTFEATLSPGA